MLPQVLHVVGTIETLLEYVNNIHLHRIPDWPLEDFIDHSLECCSDVLRAEGHNFVTVDDTASSEGCLVLIYWMHLELLVSRVSIHEAEEFVAYCRVDHLIYAGRREVVFEAGHV